MNYCEKLKNISTGDYLFRAIFLISHLFLAVPHLFLVVLDSDLIFTRLQSSDDFFQQNLFFGIRIELISMLKHLSGRFG